MKLKLLVVLMSLGVTSGQGALVWWDLRGDAAFQQRAAEVPTVAPVSGVTVFDATVTTANLTAGSTTQAVEFSLSNALGASGLIERQVRVGAVAGSIEWAETVGVTGFGAGASINSATSWGTNLNTTRGLYRYIDSGSGVSEANNFGEDEIRFAGFRLVDGGDYFYGYVELILSQLPEQPTLSVRAVAWENSANVGVVTAAIPEGAAVAWWCGLMALGWAQGRRSRRGFRVAE